MSHMALGCSKYGSMMMLGVYELLLLLLVAAVHIHLYHM
jgi:hypothetical protein